MIVRKGSDTRRASARGRDIYAFTAPLICEAVERILAGAVSQSGAVAPGEVFDSKGFLTALPLERLSFEVEGV